MSNHVIAITLIANCLLNATGTILLRMAIGEKNAVFALAGAASYLMACTLFAALLRHEPLNVVGTITSLVGLVIVIIAGIYLFDERLTPLQWVGMVLALVSVALISLPSLNS